MKSHRKAMIWRLCIVLTALSLPGCGLVFQGTKQTLVLKTQPPDAQASFAGHPVTTPGSVTLGRRRLNWSVYRATKDGYEPSCAIVFCGTPTFVKVGNSLALGFPWFVDLIAGSMRRCDAPATLRLAPVRPGVIPFTVPPDEEILRAYREGRGINMCEAPHVFDPMVAKAAERILVTTGTVGRPFVELGTVEMSLPGSDEVYSVTTAPWGWWAHTTVTHTFTQATPSEMNALLQRQALYQYGDQADAVINAHYETNPRHDVFATGLAVHFLESRSASEELVERLKRLRVLRDDGVISEQEYQRRREALLESL